MKNKVIFVVSSVIVLISIFFISMKLYKKQEAGRIGFLAQENFQIFVRDHSPKLGVTSPKVYLVEFFDPECESCREFYPIVKQLLNEFEGNIQLVLRYTPFHPNSEFVIKILEAARLQNKYWETLDIVLQHQPEWGSHHHPNPELIWQYLPRVGLDVERVKKDMDDPTIQRIITQDKEDGQRLEIRATPSFFINGKPLENFGPDFLREAILEALRNN